MITRKQTTMNSLIIVQIELAQLRKAIIWNRTKNQFTWRVNVFPNLQTCHFRLNRKFWNPVPRGPRVREATAPGNIAHAFSCLIHQAITRKILRLQDMRGSQGYAKNTTATPRSPEPQPFCLVPVWLQNPQASSRPPSELATFPIGLPIPRDLKAVVLFKTSSTLLIHLFYTRVYASK